MRLQRAAVFGAAIGQDTQQWHVLLLKPGQYPVIEQVGGHQRVLAVIQLGEGDFGVGVNEGLLVDASHPLERADLVGVLRPQLAGMLGLDLALCLLLLLTALQSDDLRFSEDELLFGSLLLQCSQALLERLQAMPQPDGTYPARRDK